MSSPRSAESAPTQRPELAPVTLWRGMIVFCALYGLYHVIGGIGGLSDLNWRGLYELSQLASLIVAVCYLLLCCFPLFTLGRRHEPRSSWLRGALAILMLLVSLTSILVLDGGKLEMTGFFFEHLVTPVLVVCDFLFVGRGQLRTKWWHPFTWLLPPLAYFGFLMGTGVQSYEQMFDTNRPSMLAMSVGGFTAGILLLGITLWALTKLLGLMVKPHAEAPEAEASPETVEAEETEAVAENDSDSERPAVSPYFVRQR